MDCGGEISANAIELKSNSSGQKKDLTFFPIRGIIVEVYAWKKLDEI